MTLAYRFFHPLGVLHFGRSRWTVNLNRSLMSSSVASTSGGGRCKRVVLTFLILMTLVLLMEITVEVFAYVFRSQVHKDLADGFEKAMASYENKPKLRAIVDALQIQFHCCGANNYTDWLTTMFGQVLPSSCYIHITQTSGKNGSTHTTNINTLGCPGVMSVWIEDHISTIAAVGVGFVFAQVIGIVVSCLYMKILRENYIPDY